jgi:pilus assembly protein Flp/PilA
LIRLSDRAICDLVPDHRLARRWRVSVDNHLAESTKDMRAIFARFARDDSGATTVEYGIIAALIGAALITALSTTGTKLTNTFNSVGNGLR